jgi:hypothetical protein
MSLLGCKHISTTKIIFVAIEEKKAPIPLCQSQGYLPYRFVKLIS